MTDDAIAFPADYAHDNGHGQPTHVRIRRRGNNITTVYWSKTPDGYRRRPDGTMSHYFVRLEPNTAPEWVEGPSFADLEEWMMDGVCEAPNGDRVEPDHPRSWIRIIGLI